MTNEKNRQKYYIEKQIKRIKNIKELRKEKILIDGKLRSMFREK